MRGRAALDPVVNRARDGEHIRNSVDQALGKAELGFASQMRYARALQNLGHELRAEAPVLEFEGHADKAEQQADARVREGRPPLQKLFDLRAQRFARLVGNLKGQQQTARQSLFRRVFERLLDGKPFAIEAVEYRAVGIHANRYMQEATLGYEAQKPPAKPE